MTISDRKIKANRKNARKSTGPQTPLGKSHSRSNARKHGLYASELVVSEEDRPTFDKLRAELKSQLGPATPTQDLAFEMIVTCSWRVRLALRLEHQKIEQELESNGRSGIETDDMVDPHHARWYGSSRQQINLGIQVLRDANAEFRYRGRFTDETKELLTRAFGPDFVDTLTRWTPLSQDAVLLADQLFEHSRRFSRPLPVTEDRVAHAKRVIIDPRQGMDMVTKLIEERRHFLEEILQIRAQVDFGPVGSSRPVDFNPGFLVAANRELRRAVDWFMHLKEMGL